MPQAVNLVVKNASAVDKTFTLITPASGDGSIAEWALKEGTISSVFPRLTASASKTSNGSRSLKVKFILPSSYQDTVTGLTNVGSRAQFHVSVSVPDDFPESKKDDFVAFSTLAFRTALMQEMIRDAVPAT